MHVLYPQRMTHVLGEVQQGAHSDKRHLKAVLPTREENGQHHMQNDFYIYGIREYAQPVLPNQDEGKRVESHAEDVEIHHGHDPIVPKRKSREKWSARNTPDTRQPSLLAVRRFETMSILLSPDPLRAEKRYHTVRYLSGYQMILYYITLYHKFTALSRGMQRGPFYPKCGGFQTSAISRNDWAGFLPRRRMIFSLCIWEIDIIA